MSKTIIKSELVLASTRVILGYAYTPDPAIRRDGIEKEYVKVSWYNPELNKKDWERSELRKAQLLEAIKQTRKELRSIPLSKQHISASKMAHNPLQMVVEALQSWANIGRFIDQLFTQGKMQLS